MPFIPHSDADVQAMLAKIGAANIDELFSEIPPHLQIAGLTKVPAGLNEMEMGQTLSRLAKKDSYDLCFIGAGAYDHHIPAAVWDIAARGEFMTAYTPYQAEASQGTLQLIYEYQTMIANLMAMDVTNASLYDGGSAVAEAVLMAARLKPKINNPRILIPTSLNPFYRQTVKTIVSQQKITLEEVPYSKTGEIDVGFLNALDKNAVAAIIIQQPNFFGQLEAVDALTDWAHAQGFLVIAVVNPIAMALLKPPGQWGETGADIVCGEGQPLGIPMASGGPYFGFFCTKQAFVRQMPGRIVGRTVDSEGNPGFVLTLQAREQHIRRSKATSNICTNQGLAVTAATLYLSLLGFEGLRKTALLSHEHLQMLIEELKNVPGVDIIFQGYRFHEVAVRLSVPVKPFLMLMAKSGIEAGFDLSENYPELGHALLICVTETKSKADLQTYIHAMKTCLQQMKQNNSCQVMGDVTC